MSTSVELGKSSGRLLRLSGTIGKRHRTFALAPGQNRIGSSKNNEIVLTDRTVSRHHALLRMGHGKVWLNDLESTNGTFVGLRRIQRAEIHPGEMLRFGTIALRLEAIDPLDAEFAFELPEGQEDPASQVWSRTGETTRVSILDPRETSWLGIAEGLARLLDEDGAAGITEAMETLRRTLKLSAVGLIQPTKGQDVSVLSSAGPITALGDSESLTARIGLLAGEPGEVAVALYGPKESPYITLAQLQRPASTLALALAGSFEGRSQCHSLLALLLRLLASCLEREAAPSETATAKPSEPRELAELTFPKSYVPGVSEAMRELYERLRPVLPSNLPILITGETGVGKEPLAQVLHHSSPRHEGPLVAINCAAIPSDLLEAELFGIARGTATGVRERRGKFLDAQRGTLLLDEIGELELHLQAKLLRALQEKEVTPVGGKPVVIDARILASTNRDLIQAMDQGTFRSDLYFRLAGCLLTVPPLRQRQEDIPRLLQHFLGTSSQAVGKSLRGVTLKALRALTTYSWPGNVRELEHEASRLAMVCEEGQMIDFPLLSPHIAEALDQNKVEDENQSTR